MFSTNAPIQQLIKCTQMESSSNEQILSVKVEMNDVDENNGAKDTNTAGEVNMENLKLSLNIQ